VRVVTEEMGHARGYLAEPTLDDAYVFAMKEGAELGEAV
jgi:hypothetical protein